MSVDPLMTGAIDPRAIRVVAIERASGVPGTPVVLGAGRASGRANPGGTRGAGAG